ncbi:unnamed protein product, partial [marine sediment metagenome]
TISRVWVIKQSLHDEYNADKIDFLFFCRWLEKFDGFIIVALDEYAKQKAVEFAKLIRLKEANREWETGKNWEDYYDEFNTNNHEGN